MNHLTLVPPAKTSSTPNYSVGSPVPGYIIPDGKIVKSHWKVESWLISYEALVEGEPGTSSYDWKHYVLSIFGGRYQSSWVGPVWG